MVESVVARARAACAELARAFADRVRGRSSTRALSIAIVVAGAVVVSNGRDDIASPNAPPAAYVGASACGTCHAKEHAAWTGSQHERAMQPANDATVLGDFTGARATFGGVTTTFFRRDTRFFVNTDGPDGTLADFEVQATFGVAPLQQYLVALPGGRLQALGIAWDTRPKAQGGQRWFHLYPNAIPHAGDRLHWSSIDQNWNHQCADCHSTHVQKNYDAATRSYATTSSEIDVACEACHGPGSNHVAWARKGPGWRRFDDRDRGLVERFAAPVDTVAALAPGRDERELASCGQCHARRAQESDAGIAGKPFGDGYRLALLDDGLYFADGQQRDEVYDVGSFLQSKMHARGVTCSDCHDPHSLTLRATGNALCTRCHDARKLDGPQHTLHARGSTASLCVTCHMPVATYMVIDARHDHSFRVPRPDRTVTLGAPNVCDGCHADRGASWAAAVLRARTGHAPAGNQRFAEALAHGGPGALLDVADDDTEPAIARATALARLGAPTSDDDAARVRRRLGDVDPLVRSAAIRALAPIAPALRAAWLAPLLHDRVLTVRIDAARAIAGAAEAKLAPAEREAFARALDEYVAVQRHDADRPEAQTNLAMLADERGDLVRAADALREALRLDPTFVPAWVNLADLERRAGREQRAADVLRDGLVRLPNEPALHTALGLSLARQGKRAQALVELGRAATLAPADVASVYAYAVALKDAGRSDDAIAALEELHRRAPGSVRVLSALAMFARDRGDVVAARGFAEQLVDAAPSDPNARRLLQSLDALESSH